MSTPRRTPALGLAALLAAAVWGAPLAAADRLELVDGRVVEGTVTREGESYRVVSRFGESVVQASDVRAWIREKSIESQWREKVASTKPGDFEGRARIARWLAEVGRAEEAKASAAALLEEDPENAVAHEVLGHVRHGGRWMTPDEAKRAEGMVERGGRWYTAEEWAVLDAAAKSKAEEAEKAEKGKRLNAEVNEAARMMLSPDKAVRAHGKARLEALAKEADSEAIRGLVPQVEAYAGAVDRMVSAITAAESATVLTEVRIQLARMKRPIQTFQTSLASNLGGAPVTLQLPELEVIKLSTTVPIPAGTR